jgi:hypothetical protein
MADCDREMSVTPTWWRREGEDGEDRIARLLSALLKTGGVSAVNATVDEVRVMATEWVTDEQLAAIVAAS